MFSQGTGLEADLPMLRVPEKVTNVGILMITGQRGRTAVTWSVAAGRWEGEIPQQKVTFETGELLYL